MESIKIENLRFSYSGVERETLNIDNLIIEKGDFACLCGESGSGKTTLLRHLKPSLSPKGNLEGSIRIMGLDRGDVSGIQEPTLIGYVLQNPDNQIVTDKVWHELAFGLENLGLTQETIRLRTAEIASFFGIQGWFHQKVNQLSGGQKQILNLASVMAMQPEILVLDEPTSQLDPIAASEFFDVIRKINRELGTTIIMTEHRLEEVVSMADQLIVLEKGRVKYEGFPNDVVRKLGEDKQNMFYGMPAPAQIFHGVTNTVQGNRENIISDYPLNVREGRAWLDKWIENSHEPYRQEIYLKSQEINSNSEINQKLINEKYKNWLKANEETKRKAHIHSREKRKPSIILKDLWFRYSREDRDILKGVNLNIYSGEILTIVGGNGTGKTTLLSVINRIQRAYRGKVKMESPSLVVTLPQNPQTLFTEETVMLELLDVAEGEIHKDGENKTEVPMYAEEKVKSMLARMELDHIAQYHPYDISGGEQQRLGLAKVLLRNPDIILLDEPTKGLDKELQRKLGEILENLRDEGKTVVVVSHDIEFCGRYADRCVLFFDGGIVSGGEPREFFSGNNFYTTATNRMCRKYCPFAILPEDAVEIMTSVVDKQIIRRNSSDSSDSDDNQVGDLEGDKILDHKLDSRGRESIFKRLCQSRNNVSDEYRKKNIKKISGQSKIYLATAVLLGALFFMGYEYGGDRSYYIVSSIIILIFLFPFFLNFEKKKLEVKVVVVIAVLIALGVAGRQAFFMIPQVKPVLAVAIISGIAFGASEGFITGAMIAFVSNFFFGQGPWTPWQMLGMGMAGLLAGILFKSFRNSRLPGKKEKMLVAVFGLISGYIYGLIVDLWTLLAYTDRPNLMAYLVVKSTAVWYDSALAISTFIFLWLIYEPMIKKLNRVKLKYGIE